MFTVGQKVEYIGPVFNGLPYGLIPPVHDTPYTVRAVGFLGEACIHLNEIVNAPRNWGNGFYELWMNARYFRPLVERKSEISFTAGADPDSEKWDNRRRVEVRA